MRTSFFPQLNYNPALIAQGAQLASGLLQSGIGLLQRGQANKWLKNNKQPIEQMPDEVLQNQNMANQMSATGLPSEQYNRAMRDIQRQQLTAMRFAGSRRGSLMALPAILQGTNDATLNLNSADANQRVNNQRYAMGINDKVAQWKSNLFKQNTLDPYNRRRDEMMGQMGSGNQNLIGGIDRSLAAGAQLMAGGKNNQVGIQSGIFDNLWG